ncbi:hypothetical protein WL74_00740 [Burkholderia cepacia]|nr:hypothetical protein WL74_00740 [Burkholderia cepacia]ONA00957.1 hypothetical protein AQ874_29505 [Burkholderia pseudomallei]ONB89131.1 hypothetical protein AQ908_27690 [Burkholderia pseudomallei]
MQRGFDAATVWGINLARRIAYILFGEVTCTAFETGKVRSDFVRGRAIPIRSSVQLRRQRRPHYAVDAARLRPLVERRHCGWQRVVLALPGAYIVQPVFLWYPFAHAKRTACVFDVRRLHQRPKHAQRRATFVNY